VIIQESKGTGGDIVRRKSIGVDVEVAVGARVGEALVLGVEARLAPAGPASTAYGAEGGVEIDKDVWIWALPEVRDA
jgi:hypothetical protein